MAFEVGSTYKSQTPHISREWRCVISTPDYVVLEREETNAIHPMKTAHVIKLRSQDHLGRFVNKYSVDSSGNVSTWNNGTFIRQDQPYDPLQNAEEDDSI